MALINFQPNPKIPPIGFFEPISVDPKDMMTDVEYLLGILKKLNSMIAQLNSNTKFIEQYSGKIEEIETEINVLQTEFNELKQDTIEAITVEFTRIRAELQAMISTALTQANAYTDSVASQLREEIEEISVGNIQVYDPTTGILSPLQVVLDNIYGSSRDDALTATEYDALDLTATAYDGYDLTAFNYDKYGKTLLV